MQFSYTCMILKSIQRFNVLKTVTIYVLTNICVCEIINVKEVSYWNAHDQSSNSPFFESYSIFVTVFIYLRLL